MKKILTLGCIAISQLAIAQWMPNGSVLNNNFVLTDINGGTHDIFSYANSGKHIFFDMFQMNCGNCEYYHDSKAFENYHNAYAKAGTPNDAVLIQHEVDPASTLNALKGLTTASSFDWITGTSYATINDAAPNWNVFDAFLPAGTTSLNYGTPTLMLICPDKKFYKFFTSENTSASLRALAISKCGLAPTGVNDVHTASFTYSISPNPANSEITLAVANTKSNNMAVVITNTLGQIVYNQTLQNSITGNTSYINTSNWANGMYIVQLKDGLENITSRIMVNH